MSVSLPPNEGIVGADTASTGAVTRPASHGQCMACGASAELGLRFHATGTQIKASLLLRTEWQGYSGALHGGMTATLLDAAMTHCLFHQGIEAMTADLRVRYLQPVACPGLVEVAARLVRQRKNIFELDAELRAGGIVKARANARFMRRKTLLRKDG